MPCLNQQKLRFPPIYLVCRDRTFLPELPHLLFTKACIAIFGALSAESADRGISHTFGP